jgi:hypothetical protein
MHFDTEPSIDGSDTPRRGQIGLFGLEVGDEVYHLRGDLMAAFWSARPRYEAGRPRCRYRTLSLIEGGARDTEGGRGVADGHPLGIVTTDHLVADLNEVLGVEERVAREERVADGFRMRIKRSIARQSLALRIAPRWRKHTWIPD